MNLRSKLSAFTAATVGALVASPAFAVIDTTEALAAVTDAEVFILAVGMAVLGLIFVVKGIKWARKAG